MKQKKIYKRILSPLVSSKCKKSVTVFGVAMLALPMIFTQTLHAEGTKQVSPNINNVSALLIHTTSLRGPYLSEDLGIVAQRLRVRIADYTNEKIYFGFGWKNYGSTDDVDNVWMRIYDPSGAEVLSARYNFNSTSDGWISSTIGGDASNTDLASFTAGYNKAVAGPNGVNGVTDGYVPHVFTPTMDGEYSIVFYRSDDGGNSMITSQYEIRAPFWDITVGNTTLPIGNQVLEGRLFSNNWSFVANNAINFAVSNTAAAVQAKAAPSFYSYSHDQTLIKLGFGLDSAGNGGFMPIAYNVGFTHYGIDESLSWGESRKSIYSATNPSILNGYKVFLSAPDSELYPIQEIEEEPAMAAVPITGCPGGDLTAHFYIPADGDVRILFDIDGDGDGYTPGTRDFVLEAFDQPSGYGTIVWNGRDGAGNYLASGTTIQLTATYQRGRFNFPIYDAEVNKLGMYIETIAPLSSPSNRLYWNDVSLPNQGSICNSSNPQNNITGAGLNNSFSGTLSSASSPTRAWNGDGNLDNVVPAPAVASNDENLNQCDDYGNVRALNTWGWALEAESDVKTFAFGCYDISGNVYSDADGLTNGLVDNSGTIAIPSGLYVHLIAAGDSVVKAVVPLNSDGTYNFENIPSADYMVVLSTTELTVNTVLDIDDITLPTEWEYVGEQIGVTEDIGIDAEADGIISFSLNGDMENVNFGISKINTTNAVNDENSTWVNTPVSGNVVTNDFDREGHVQNFGTFLNAALNPLTIGATIPGVDAAGAPVSDAGIITFDDNGNYTYTPASGFVGSVSIPYSICDVGEPQACDTAYLDITVSPGSGDGNSVIANNDEYYTLGTTVVSSNVLINDADPQGDAFEVISFTYDSDGDGVPDTEGVLGAAPLVVAGVDKKGNPVANAGTVTLDANGDFLFIPNVGFSGKVYLEYVINDDITPTPASDNATIVISVLNDNNGTLNDPPVAGDDFVVTHINTPVSGDFASNDKDLNGDPISIKDEDGIPVTIVPGGAKTPVKTESTEEGGTVIFYSDGTYTYTPPVDFVGPDRVVYEICDVTTVEPQPLCAEATIHLLVGNGIRIAGNVWHDSNGNAVTNPTENPVSGDNGDNDGDNSSVTGADLYASIVNTENEVIASVKVGNDGSFEFDGLPIGSEYTVILTTATTVPVIGSTLTSGSLPDGWSATGVNIEGTPDITNRTNVIVLGVVRQSVNTADFGIQQPPVADPKSYTVAESAFSDAPPTGYPTVPGYMSIPMSSSDLIGYDAGGSLSGSDPEDCSAMSSCNTGDGSTFTIHTINSNTILYYDFGDGAGPILIDVTSGPINIPNFDVTKMLIYGEEGAGTTGNELGFTYSMTDKAGFQSSAVAYTIATSNPLPIELLSFNADIQNTAIVLKWITASEQNNKGFDVERSTNARSWNTLSFVPTKAVNGNSTEVLEYLLTDKQPSNGVNYYRLKQLDNNGRYRYSEVRVVRFGQASQIIISPNPTNGVVAISGFSKGKNQIVVTNAIGQILMNKEIDNLSSYHLDLTRFVFGTYYISIRNEDGNISNHKLVIQ
jgi:hypothetical protein